MLNLMTDNKSTNLEMNDQENESEALIHILTDATAEPIMLSYRFLESITDNFSQDLEIGTGGFGVVYMGIVQNMKVAIKKLSRIDDFSEKQFEDELKCLKRVKHKNIVRFLGYCSDTQEQVVVYKGTYVLAECRKRFLCFEYAPNKSLEDYIKDESCHIDWDTRYQLIKGICRGLHYLHNKERINHLDLKPANILLDGDMVPKITDFGLSRRFSGEQSRIITEHVHGTPGYIAPEYIDKGEISFKTDIYSLGIIISKLLIQMNDDLFDHKSWHKSPDIVCSRAKVCIKIAQLCVDADQQRRPNIDDIIDMLNLMTENKSTYLEMSDQENESEALMHILTDATAEPIMLSYRFLESITDNFSQDLEIGTGGFGVVYLGIVQNMKVAVKKLSRIDDFSEKQFEDELKCLKRVKHKNIVRFIGYCSDTQKEVVVYKGMYVLADCRKRFLCFEYAPNKSLEDYIKDQSRHIDWDTRYQLINGICRGLHYLHNKEHIHHLDLKPANILLDADMVPKITDFGLSRRFSGEQSRIITEHVCGTLGYIAPEYIDKGEISFKTDIYSLGFIISKLLSQRNDDLDHKGWHISADMICSRAKACMKIAQLCVDDDQQRRPNIDDIIDMLNLMGTLKDNLEFSLEQIKCNGTTSKVTDIYSLEFCFPFKPNKRLHYPMTLTNGTDHYVGVWITPISANSRVNESFEGPCSFSLIKPNSTWVATVTTKEQERLPSRDTHKFKMMILIMGSSIGSMVSMRSDILKLVKDSGGNKLPQAMLSAAVDNRANCNIVATHEAMSSPRTSRDGCCLAMDVHPTEPWIIMGHHGGIVSIWNYETQQRVNEPFQMTTCGVCSVKFIARDQWFAVAAGDAKGSVHVFNNSCFEGNNKVEAFEAHPDKYVDSLAVHPTYPILLSSSCEDSIIKRWDRDQDQDWKCTQIFNGHTSGVRCLAFNPRDTNSFASIGVEDDSKVWNINSSNAITPSPVEPEDVDCFFSDRCHRHFMIRCDDDQIEIAEIWDARTHDHLQTLGVFLESKLLKNNVRVKDCDKGNSSEKKSDHGSEIPAPGQIKKASAKNNGKIDSDAKDKNHGGKDDHVANNVAGASGRLGAGNPGGNKGKGQMESAPTSTPIGHPNSSMPSGHIPPPSTTTAGLYYQAGDGDTYLYNIFRDPFQISRLRYDNDVFSDENPNSCSVM